MAIRGIRGAITVAENNKEEVLKETQVLLKEIIKVNKLKIEDIAAINFSATSDIDAVFPAQAARELGFNYTPLICSKEMDVQGSLKKCIRILMLVNSRKKQQAMIPVYLKEALTLRPDTKKYAGRKAD
jgi:chorismate mutase